jgi:5-methylcytosine-specific restriction endonuclease McrA
MNINPYLRYQSGFCIEEMFPHRTDGICACGCSSPLTGRRRRWANKKCSDKANELFNIVKGDGRMIRKALYRRGKGICAHCGVDCVWVTWEADHILPIHRGGGGCDLDNFQTLCPSCHKTKTKEDGSSTKMIKP